MLPDPVISIKMGLSKRIYGIPPMALISSFNEDRPVSYFRGYPIYHATLITIAYAVGVIVTTVLLACRIDPGVLLFSPSDSLLRGHLWQVLTCTFVNQANFFTIVSLFFIYLCAVEIEKYIGTVRFLTLYGFLLFAPLLFELVIRLVGGFSPVYGGSRSVTIGFFIAYCTLYPNLQWFGVVPMRFLAIASLVIESISCLSPFLDWVGLANVWIVSGGAFGYIRFLQFGGQLPDFRRWIPRPKPKLHVVPNPRSKSDSRRFDSIDIDRVLDKISKHGLASLTSQEKATLERARERLIEKDTDKGENR
jgi:hypothetical protein